MFTEEQAELPLQPSPDLHDFIDPRGNRKPPLASNPSHRKFSYCRYDRLRSRQLIDSAVTPAEHARLLNMPNVYEPSVSHIRIAGNALKYITFDADQSLIDSVTLMDT